MLTREELADVEWLPADVAVAERLKKRWTRKYREE